jgi:large subunit ribosomal protein L32e
VSDAPEKSPPRETEATQEKARAEAEADRPAPPKSTKAEREEQNVPDTIAPAPTPKKSERRRKKAPAEKDEASASEAEEAGAKEEGEKPKKRKAAGPKAPRRPTLDPEARRLIAARRDGDRHRPRFVRQATNRYWRIGRRGSWRRPRGLQSKQRRHYGYRPQVVRVGYGSPRLVRHLTPSGFRPRLVRAANDLEGLDVQREAALIARTVGTRKRLLLEETARKKGIHVLNPIEKERTES